MYTGHKTGIIAKVPHHTTRVYQAMMETTANSSSVEQQIKRNYRWNFLVNSLDGATFWFGMSFISATVILPLYVSHFTANPLLIGLIPFLATAGVFLPQLFVANVVERAPSKKFFPVSSSNACRFSYWFRPPTSWRQASRF
jgi:hypothetical protein